MSDSKKVILAANGLAKDYRGGIQALLDVSFTVRAGEVLGLLGPNGAGKSTTIGVVLGLIEPSRGTAQLFDRPPRDPVALAHVGYMPETPVFAGHHTALSLLRFHGRLLGMAKDPMIEHAERALVQAGVYDIRKRRLQTLSKGFVQRVALAVALLGRPDLLVLDEPTSNLDPVGRRELGNIMDAQRARGKAVIFASHVLSEIETACDRVVILKAGRLVLEGTVHHLCEGSRSLEEVFFEAIR